MYLINLLLYAVGTTLLTIGLLLTGGGEAVLGMRTRNILIYAMVVQAFSFYVVRGLTPNVGTLEPQHARHHPPQLYAPPAQVTSDQPVRVCLMDSGSTACITASYYGEIPDTRRPTEVPQGFKQGTGILTCDTTFLARRDLAGTGTGKGNVACTVMEWQHTDATQFKIVSEGYLRDKMGCSFIDQPGQQRRCTFPDGTVVALRMTSTGLGFARFMPPDLTRFPMRCAKAKKAIAEAAALAPLGLWCWDTCCLALFSAEFKDKYALMCMLDGNGRMIYGGLTDKTIGDLGCHLQQLRMLLSDNGTLRIINFNGAN